MKAQELWQSSLLIAGLLSAASIAACSAPTGGGAGFGGPGSMAGPGSSSGANGASSSGSSSGGGTGAGSDGGSGAGPAITAAVVPESAGTTVMRRLTYREYDHMMARLLGDTTSPASGASPWTPDAAAATGFVSPNTVSNYHVIEYNQTAETLVNTAVQAVAAGQTAGKFVIPCKNPTAAMETSCAMQFITTFGLQAFRRPVAPAEQADLLTVFSTVRTMDMLSFTDSIGAVAKAMLQSPNFLYHWEIGPTKPVLGSDGLAPLTPWQIASRLATSLWESMPDDALFTAAQNGQLSTAAQVIAQAQRMIADPQATQSLYSFHLQWIFNMGFHVTDLATVVAKPNSLLTTAAAQGLQTEFTQFLSSVYTPPGDGTLNTLYTAPYAFVNQDLAAIYGVVGPATGFAKVNLDPTQRGGIFTQVSFLAGIEDTLADNPVYRGLAIYTKALCGTIGGPPANVPGVTFKPGGTTRQAYDAHGSSACAIGCHGIFDPPGFAFENYDGIGQYRTTEGSQPVDATGTFSAPVMASAAMSGGTTFTFKNAVELTKQLAASPEAQACVDLQWTRYMLGRMETAADVGSLQLAYHAGAATAGFSVRDMLVALLSSKAFLYRQPSVGEPL
jgi:uncharacterized protein DUF1592/uncharacterized protein DUF1588/uncharacterized protein DUF1595/uncharacterized protein DUF1585